MVMFMKKDRLTVISFMYSCYPQSRKDPHPSIPLGPVESSSS
jgi:hypothetical protein